MKSYYEYRQIMAMFGTDRGVLDHYTTMGWVTCKPNPGRGNPRRYTKLNVVEFALVGALIANGFRGPSVTRVMKTIRKTRTKAELLEVLAKREMGLIVCSAHPITKIAEKSPVGVSFLPHTELSQVAMGTFHPDTRLAFFARIALLPFMPNQNV